MPAEFKCESEYLSDENILIHHYIGKPIAHHEVDYWLEEKIIPTWKGDGKHKIWGIGDFSRMHSVSPSLIRYYYERIKDLVYYYGEGYVLVVTSTFARLAVSVFMKLSGIRFVTVSSVDVALKIVRRWHKEKGVFVSLHGE